MITQPIQLIIKPETPNLSPYLERAKQLVLSAKTPQERFKWLVIQAALEARINQAQKAKAVV